MTIDLISKSIFTGKYYGVLEGVFSIFYTENTGAGFSVLSNSTILLTVITAVVLIGLIALNIFVKPQTKTYSIGMGLVLAGAVGNLIDRVFFGYVRDFIKLEFIDFPIFNFADICLTIGAILICVVLLFFKTGNSADRN